MRRALPYVILVAGVGVACGNAFTQDDGNDGHDGGGTSATDSGGDDEAGDGSQILVTPEAGQRQDGGDAAPTDAADDMPMQGADAVTPLPDASPDASQPVDASAPMDVFVPPPTDACTGEVANESTGYFVQVGGAASGCGSRATPCGSVQTAVTLASQNGLANVYVAGGTYTEQVTLASNVAIQGGWNDSSGTWTRDCAIRGFADTTIKAPAGVGTTVIADGVTNAVLDTLSVASMDQSAVAAGQSLYGVFARNGATLTLSNVEVSVVTAGTGTSGAPGGNGTSATTTCSPGSTGAAGTTMPDAAHGAAGTYDVTGYTPATAATGATGGAGQTGTAAPAQGQSNGPTCASGLAPSTCATDLNTPPGTCPSTLNGSSCGSVGSSGCGGTGTGGGGGGGGGGSSIALVIWGSTVIADGGLLSTGNGGAGGAGMAAGPTPGSGAPGTAGSAGDAVSPGCISGTNPNPPHNATCTPKTSSIGAAGAAGGTGGSGGLGGAGGGGAGGDSYAYYAGGGGNIVSTTTMLSNGSGGTGGTGGSGSNGGPDGTGLPHN